jgi:hypothetical protein
MQNGIIQDGIVQLDDHFLVAELFLGTIACMDGDKVRGGIVLLWYRVDVDVDVQMSLSHTHSLVWNLGADSPFRGILDLECRRLRLVLSDWGSWGRAWRLG